MEQVVTPPKTNELGFYDLSGAMRKSSSRYSATIAALRPNHWRHTSGMCMNWATTMRP